MLKKRRLSINGCTLSLMLGMYTFKYCLHLFVRRIPMWEAIYHIQTALENKTKIIECYETVKTSYALQQLVVCDQHCNVSWHRGVNKQLATTTWVTSASVVRSEVNISLSSLNLLVGCSWTDTPPATSETKALSMMVEDIFIDLLLLY